MSDSQYESQRSWLATVTFAFVAMYTHLSLGISMMSMESLIYFAAGIGICRLVLDIPAQLVQRTIYRKNTDGLTGEAKRQATEKAGAIGTFVKAAQVIIAFAATKLSHPYFF